MLADSCGATQLKEGLSVSSAKGEGPAGLIEYNKGGQRRRTSAPFILFYHFYPNIFS